ncbi:hypothetical protein H4R18_005168 [Coemansia javaensis]|uniref:SLC41A/MgtE integral membrane domain-containing protein n=1 Tax=Coemansia javaensis TaxID=2761396 RepID=A0A9W8H5U4_9FUNG|nr:hypothetical protein H4R18_005168 [Coemansia javaensis]
MSAAIELADVDAKAELAGGAGHLLVALPPSSAGGTRRNSSNGSSSSSFELSVCGSAAGADSFELSACGRDGGRRASSDVGRPDENGQRRRRAREVAREMVVEVVPALLVAVAGSVVAGSVLGGIQGSRAFERIPALFIMVTVLLNLKSNIELNMSARLSTLANLGVLDSKAEAVAATRSNMELLLLQSTIVGASVGLISVALSLLPGKGAAAGGGPFWADAAVLLAAGTGSTVAGSAVVGVLISATVHVGRACGVDPDNIGTPIASSFGDMTTLMLVGALASGLVAVSATAWPAVVAAGFVALGAALLRVVRANRQMAHHVGQGWLPLVYAAATSSVAGLIVEKCAPRFPGMPALVPVINGIGGNIGTVFASRVSTSLHRRPAHHHRDQHRLVMLILLAINVPVQVAFLLARQAMDPAAAAGPAFLLAYTVATVAHGLAMLVLGRAVCTLLWARGYDPDDYVNPLVTGTGDMLGTILLALVFLVAS